MLAGCHRCAPPGPGLRCRDTGSAGKKPLVVTSPVPGS